MDREAVFEVEGGVGTDGELSAALVGKHPGAEGGAFGGVGLEREEVGAGEPGHAGVLAFAGAG